VVGLFKLIFKLLMRGALTISQLLMLVAVAVHLP
jgi:hypothetical protein